MSRTTNSTRSASPTRSPRLPALALTSALMIPAAAHAQILPPIKQTVERVFPDNFGGFTVHYSIAQMGPLLNPNGYVSVGRRDVAGLGTLPHIKRYDAYGAAIPGMEAVLMPISIPSDTMIAYSVDVMANGDFLVAGVFENTNNSAANVFVSRVDPNSFYPTWTTILLGSFSDFPDVTARELSDGNIIVVHNDLAPLLARATLLDAGGSRVWSQQYFFPAGAASFLADVRQNPASPNEVVAAGFTGSTAVLFNIDLTTGCAAGEGAWLFPHPQFSQTWFTALTYDTHPDGSYTLVAAGAGWNGNIIQPNPRIVDVGPYASPINWDYTYDTALTPAPTAVSVNRGGGNHLVNADITVAGSPTFEPVGRMLRFNTGTFLTGNVASYTAGAPLTNINDLCNAGTMIGASGTGFAALDDYLILSRSTACAQITTAGTFGPGSEFPVLPGCESYAYAEALHVRPMATDSADISVCKAMLTVGDAVKYFKFP